MNRYDWNCAVLYVFGLGCAGVFAHNPQERTVMALYAIAAFALAWLFLVRADIEEFNVPSQTTSPKASA